MIARFLRNNYGGLPASAWAICGAAFVNRAGSMVLPYLSLYLGARFGFSVEHAGYFVSLYGIGSVLGSLLGGRLIGPLGPVRVQLLTLTATAIWMWALTLAGTPLSFGIGIFVLGALNDAFRPGNMAAVLACVPPELGPSALALNRIAVNAGWAIGPTVGGQLAELDFRLLFVADGATCALAAVVLLLMVPRRLPFEGLAAASPGQATDSPAARVRSPWHDGPFLALLAVTVVNFLAFMQYFSTETRYLESAFGCSKSDIGWLLAINPTLIVLGEMPLVRALRGRPRLPIVAFGTALIAISFPLLVPTALGKGGVLAHLFLLTLGEMFSFSLLGSFVSDRAPAALRGDYLGVYGAAFSFAFVLAPGLGGLVYDQLGADVLWYGACAASTLATVGYLLLHRVSRRNAAAGPTAT